MQNSLKTEKMAPVSRKNVMRRFDTIMETLGYRKSDLYGLSQVSSRAWALSVLSC